MLTQYPLLNVFTAHKEKGQQFQCVTNKNVQTTVFVVEILILNAKLQSEAVCKAVKYRGECSSLWGFMQIKFRCAETDLKGDE